MYLYFSKTAIKNAAELWSDMGMNYISVPVKIQPDSCITHTVIPIAVHKSKTKILEASDGKMKIIHSNMRE